MENEKEFKEALSKLTHDQLIDLAFKLKTEVHLLQEKNSSLKRSMYGRKRENVNADQLSLFNEAEVVEDSATPEEKVEPEITVAVKKKKRGKNTKLKELEVKKIDIVMENPVCDICGGPLEEVKPKVLKRLVYKPAEIYIEETIIHQYTCHKCSDAEETMYLFQNEDYKEPRQLLKGSMFTAQFLSNCAYKKFVMGVPYYRQEKDLNHAGIPISRQILCNWIMRCGDAYLKPIFNKMEQDIRQAKIVNMDETTLLCLEERKDGRESSSYEWLCMTNEYEEKQMALYYYKKDRKHDAVAEILGDSYTGIIQSDGYQAYSQYTSASGHAGCLAHARRKFEDALQANPDLYKKIKNKGISKEEKQKLLEDNPSFHHALWIVNQYDAVLKIERQAKLANKSIEEIKEIRRKKEKPILDELYTKANKLIEQCAPSGKLYKALQYTINQWQSLIYYLQDGRIPATNNIVEREGIKPFVIARKNFLFADTRQGARISSIWFSLIISAKMNHLNMEKYLAYVLEQMSSEERITEEMINRCLPYSKSIPNSIKL